MSLDIKTKKANLETALDALYNQAAAVTANSAASDVLNLLRGINEAEKIVDEIKMDLGPEENVDDNPSSDNVPEEDSAKVDSSNQDNTSLDDTAKDPEASTEGSTSTDNAAASTDTSTSTDANTANEAPADAQPAQETTVIDGSQTNTQSQ